MRTSNRMQNSGRKQRRKKKRVNGLRRKGRRGKVVKN